MKNKLNCDSLNLRQQQKAAAILHNCVHCGFCLPTCPTYDLLGNELDSPRGRIYLIKQVLEGYPVSQTSLLHLDRCLSCRACETACPSGVRYTQLLEIGRSVINKKVPRSFWQQCLRYSVRKTLTTPWLFNALVTVAPWLKQSNIKSLKPFPLAINASPKKKILLLSGCVQPALAPNINHSIKHILIQLGYDVIETPQAQCCGALDQHLDANTDAMIKIKQNIDQCYHQLTQGVEVIISSASGCGVMIKDYPDLLSHDSIYAEKANKVATKMQDIAEFLSGQDLSIFIKKNKSDNVLKLSFHSPCTLQHGLKISEVIEKILVTLGYQLTQVDDVHLCCGSAGTYSIFQPKISQELSKNKLENLIKGQPEIIVTANIGCLVHLQKSSKIPVKHWVELIVL